MKNFLDFNKMITPSIIKIIFIIGVVISVLMGISLIGAGLDNPYGGSGSVFMGLLTIVIGPLVTRVYCEIIIVVFKMHESLHDINSKIKVQEDDRDM
ncbi:hypothetical protein AAV35_002555 [Salimicrobium jeotgali]|uniref:DUF4282 domain-containing protein n=1 Tax=Salimicrobium jeotgali TaxID=1230341 RepID=K2GA95_9BACI|nr:DUF4282 domain-containing protein [Salimicrobium jeotgali]AKG03779.1 hypothetical protein AAV35_002555 [Salimicrobium jeotgali]EKE31262.1 hypothetical protein MJ3_09158 [Salimicrobium jeotgali]MBM7697075.1 hypothetical protein [Salimicrobium jeotgali]